MSYPSPRNAAPAALHVRSMLVVSMLVAAGPSGAQTTAPDSAPRAVRDSDLPASRPRLRVAGGVDARSLGSLAQFGVEWPQRGSRPALRAELSALHDRETLGASYLAFGCEGGCTTRATSTRLGFGLDAKYELLRGTVRPYVVSGLGFYQARVRTTRDFACVSTTTSPFVSACQPTGVTQPFYAYSSNALALHAGGGLAVMVGRTQLFGELRLQTPVDSYGPPSRGASPIVFGLRF